MPIVKRKFCPSLLIYWGLAGQVSYDLKLVVLSSGTGKVQSKLPFEQSISQDMFAVRCLCLILTSKLFMSHWIFYFLMFILLSLLIKRVSVLRLCGHVLLFIELAKELEFNDNEVQQVRMKNPNSLQEQSTALLQRWTEREGKHATGQYFTLDFKFL